MFRHVRVEREDDLPPMEERTIDVAILDMNHGWLNLGHDALVYAVRDAACDLRALHAQTGISVRAISFGVRRSAQIPQPPGARFRLFIGTGGPGHLDPRLNDGSVPESQGILENPVWEAPLFHLFDRILEDPEAAMLAVCHSFGVMCRWSGVAKPVLRSPEKGGKSTGVLENLLTSEAIEHPWFCRLADELPDGRRLRIVDTRLFDLIPTAGARFPPGMTPLGYETIGVGGPRGEALTMLEFARDAGGVMPRVLGVNHHPEIVNRARELQIVQEKLRRGDATLEWATERREILTRILPDEDSDHRLQLTSDFTLLGPLRFHLYRQVRRRCEALGLSSGIHEESIPESVAASAVRS